MRFEQSIDVDAPVETVWSFIADVETWHEWTPSISRIERLDDEPFGLGSKARVKQPRFPALVWEVTAFEPGRSFSWTQKSPGMTSVGDHAAEPRTGGGTRVTLAVEQRGPLAPVFGLLTGRLTRRYVDMEARGLKARAEAAAGGSPG